MGGHPVRDRVGAARIVGHVPADAARVLTAGIGRVEVARVPHGPRDLDVGHARLHDDDAVREVHLEDAVHPGHHDDQAADDRQRPAGDPGAGAPGHHRDPVPRRDPEHPGHLFGRPRQHGKVGHRGDVGGVVLVRQEVARFREHVGGPDRLAQFPQEGVAGGDPDPGHREPHQAAGRFEAFQAAMPPTRSATSGTPCRSRRLAAIDDR